MPFGNPTNTPQCGTGNPRTSYDKYTPAPGATTPGGAPPIFGGLLNPLGTTWLDVGGNNVGSPNDSWQPSNPNYVQTLYKYVLYQSTTNPALTTAPGLVYYTDETATVVSGSPTDALGNATASWQSAAGVMMLNTTALTTATATLLNNGSNGSGIWIAIGGFVKGAVVPSTVTFGDTLYGIATGGTAFQFTRLATAISGNTGQSARVVAIALSAAAQIGATGVYTADINIVLVPQY